MAVSKNITLAHNDNETVYIDAYEIEVTKRAIKADLKNIIADIESIQKAYNTLASHSATKGSWKDTADKCVKKCKTYKSNLSTLRTSLENKIDDAVIQYVLTQLQALTEADNAAEAINTNA